MVEEALRQEMLDLMPRLRRYAYGLAGNHADADDLLQKTYEKALEHLSDWQAGTRLDSWMFKITRNLFLNHVRAVAVRRNAAPQLVRDQPASHDGVSDMEGRITLERTRALVAKLPEEQRSVLLLVAVEGLAYHEAAEVLGLPAGTVASRLGRARRTLRDWLNPAAPETPPALHLLRKEVPS